jgi:hypothetical protein
MIFFFVTTKKCGLGFILRLNIKDQLGCGFRATETANAHDDNAMVQFNKALEFVKMSGHLQINFSTL